MILNLPLSQKWFRATLSCLKLPPGSLLAAESGPTSYRTTFGKVGPVFAAKSGPSWATFGCQYRFWPGPLFT